MRNRGREGYLDEKEEKRKVQEEAEELVREKHPPGVSVYVGEAEIRGSYNLSAISMYDMYEVLGDSRPPVTRTGHERTSGPMTVQWLSRRDLFGENPQAAIRRSERLEVRFVEK